MAELIPTALGWIDAKKRAARQTLLDAYKEATDSPLQAAISLARGAGRGGLQMAEMAGSVIPGFPTDENLTDKILPPSGSGAESVGEFLGPPMKLGAKALGVLGATMLPAKILHESMPIHKEMTSVFHDLVNNHGWSPETAGPAIKENYIKWNTEHPHEHFLAWEPPSKQASPFSAPPQEKWQDWQAGVAEGGLPSIDPGLLHTPSPATPAPSSQLLDALYAHGLNQEDLNKIQEFKPRESALDTLQKFERAQMRGVSELGLPANNTAQDRARAMGFPYIADPEQYSWRGNSKPRAELRLPIEAPPDPLGFQDNHNSARAMDAVFVSDPGGTAYRGFGPYHTPMVHNVPEEKLFDPANVEHQNQFVDLYGQQHGAEAANDIRESWKAWPDPRKAWDTTESDPRITQVMRDLGYQGFKTSEAGTNTALFDPSVLRHPLAAFDPANRNMRDLFAGVGGTSLAAALAAQGLPVSTPDGSQ